MSEFKVGDKIRVVNDHQTWLDNKESYENVFTIVDSHDHDRSFDDEKNIATLLAANTYPSDFKLVTEKPLYSTGGFIDIGVQSSPLIGEVTSEDVVRADTLGVYRPNLEDRKVGKVRVELVDHGFPLALREIAKVMTWAQTAKGYLDHDWQNLPNPEQGLGGATSRHCTDNIIQRMVEGKPAIECTDHESNILHKAHEAFGVLAQLELILRGIIK